jgi:DNA-binding CsgD family transcriptional regulator/tetratricopeptide (TPR) repeat protein
MNTLGVSLTQMGDCEGGLAISRASFEATRSSNNLHDLGRAYANLATVLEICGRDEESIEVSREASAWAERNGLWRTYGAFNEGNLASMLVGIGRWTEAASLLARADDTGLEGATAMNHLINDGPLAVRMGNLERAHRLLEDARIRASNFRDAQFTGPLVVGLVELALAEGRLDDAWITATSGSDRLASTEDATNRAAVAAVLARVATERILAARDRHALAGASAIADTSRRVIAEARALVGRLDSSGAASANPEAFLQLADAEAARADGEGEPGVWDAVAQRWAGMSRPYQVAYARYREGEALLAAGGNRAIVAARLTEARDIAARLGAALLRADVEALARRARVVLANVEPIPAETVPAGTVVEPAAAVEPPPLDDPFGLTPREREVLALVAAGNTNRRIADELFISENTAGVHVSNILGKLGVASRTEAAAVAVRLGLAG